MAELVHRHPSRVTGPDGNAYSVNVWAEAQGERWMGWLEFKPMGGAEGSLRSDPETTQSNRAAVVHWAQALNPSFLEGAFNRASRGATRPLATHLVARLRATLPRQGGLPYAVRVYAEEEPAGTWLGIVEFEPEKGGPVVRALRETSQPTAAQVEYWAGGLEPVYLEGALSRARAS